MVDLEWDERTPFAGDTVVLLVHARLDKMQNEPIDLSEQPTFDPRK